MCCDVLLCMRGCLSCSSTGPSTYKIDERATRLHWFAGSPCGYFLLRSLVPTQHRSFTLFCLHAFSALFIRCSAALCSREVGIGELCRRCVYSTRFGEGLALYWCGHCSTPVHPEADTVLWRSVVKGGVQYHPRNMQLSVV